MSAENGYLQGGGNTRDEGFPAAAPPPITNYAIAKTLDKFPFAISATGEITEIGDSTFREQASGTGMQTTSKGYIVGGEISTPNPYTNPSISCPVSTIDEFPFAAPSATSTDVGELIEGYRMAGHTASCSTNDGYMVGGGRSPGILQASFPTSFFPVAINFNTYAKSRIEKFSFTSKGSMTSVSEQGTGNRMSTFNSQS